jgi:iron-sulfur cluster repair protein YtfE (RIC family)
MGSERMEVKKFQKSYTQLLEVMVEHAQMEERVVFPLLETAERGKELGTSLFDRYEI